MSRRKVMAKVSYVLVINVLKEVTISIKSLGTVVFEPGTYIYIGSANVKNPLARVLRHFKRNKRVKWHIDYLTSAPEARVTTAIVCYGLTEEAIYSTISQLEFVSVTVRGFGSTDCRKHATHLFKLERRKCSIQHLVNLLSEQCKYVEAVASYEDV
ncbi:MAG: GIY-YIG nuclease family protein [Desulfurococcales archaeon]|nr:GIY-YIG nuclease family protein [Desulfurococcales archaeon]